MSLKLSRFRLVSDGTQPSARSKSNSSKKQCRKRLWVLRASRHCMLRLGQVVVRGCIVEGGGAHGPRTSPNRLRRCFVHVAPLADFTLSSTLKNFSRC